MKLFRILITFRLGNLSRISFELKKFSEDRTVRGQVSRQGTYEGSRRKNLVLAEFDSEISG